MIGYKVILWFILYSFFGWVYETTLCSIEERKFVNRGFVNGPYCPIYGFGAILDILLIGWIDNFIVLFFVGMLVTGILEYFTSWLLEVLFHAKWWDYSYMKLNINGRVSLPGAILFGLLSVVLIKFIHPFIIGQTDRLPDPILMLITILLSMLILFDTIYTLIHFSGFQKKLKQIHVFIENTLKSPQMHMGKALSQIEDNSIFVQIRERLKALAMKMNYQEKRILKAFPRFTSLRYNDVLIKIKEYVKQQNGENSK